MSQTIIRTMSNHESRHILKRFLANLISALFLTASACDSSLVSNANSDSPQEDTARFLLLRNVRWPGGGREMTLGVLNQATGATFHPDLSARLLSHRTDGVAITMKAQRVTLDPGYTALLLPPSQTAIERANLAQAILGFVASRPPSERIALYRHGATVQIFSNFLQDRTKLSEALDRYQKGIDDTNPLPLLQAVGPVASDVGEVGGSGPDVMRSLVVLATDPQSVFTNYSEVYVIAISPDAAGLAAAASAIDDARQNAFYKLSACSSEDKFSAKLQVANMPGELSASFPATLPEELGASCNVESIDSTKRVFTPRIEFVFDAAQRAAHATRVQAAQGAGFNEALAKSDFQTQIRLAPGQPTILATAHLHGKSSLGCARKSYNIELPGPARYLMPDSASDKFLLVSMCDDPAYLFAPTTFELLTEDLFTLKHRFVEFVLDGQIRGIYMLLEKADEGLVRDSARASSVMRRVYPVASNDVFEVAYSDTSDLAAPLARYNSFKTRIASLSGDALLSALRDQLDLDQYLRYLGNESILKSGDYIDEAFYVGTEQATGFGGTNEAYHVNAWDPEGYTTCHAGGANAYVDANQLAYCAEARLDFKILADPKVYALLVTKMKDGLNGALAREKMVAALNKTKTSLQSMLTVPAICAAMTELLAFNAGAANCTVARSVLDTRATAILAAYDARRTFLLPQLAKF